MLVKLPSTRPNSTIFGVKVESYGAILLIIHLSVTADDTLKLPSYAQEVNKVVAELGLHAPAVMSPY